MRRDTGSEVLPVEVFVSYTHVDEDLWKALGEHLSLLKRQQRISVWHDRRIVAGAEWKGQIDSHLRSAGMVLLLVSPSFVDSDYDWTKAERELRAKLDDWKGLLQRQVPQARQILKKLLAGPIRFTPVRDGGERYHTLTAPIALDRVIAGTVGATMMASPTGVAPFMRGSVMRRGCPSEC